MGIKKSYDITTIVPLYKDFLEEVYKDRCIATLDTCTKIVQSWITAKIDIYLLYKDKEAIGLFMGYVDDEGGILVPAFRAEIVYVKPGYRKYKEARDLFLLPIKLATEANLPVISKGSVYNNIATRHKKLGGTLIFEERILNVIT